MSLIVRIVGKPLADTAILEPHAFQAFQAQLSVAHMNGQSGR